MTRIQDEHDEEGSSQSEYKEFSLDRERVSRMKPDAIIMHPLPRRGEIDVSVDRDPRAMYWRQERNGMWIRAALIARIFGSDERLFSEGEGFLR
jgi:aspartate carbamoyltransferase catalytic subunit